VVFPFARKDFGAYAPPERVGRSEKHRGALLIAFGAGEASQGVQALRKTPEISRLGESVEASNVVLVRLGVLPLRVRAMS
jgi:hypothetical protein